MNFTCRAFQQPVIFYGNFFVKSDEKWRKLLATNEMVRGQRMRIDSPTRCLCG
jgi:hypothetical protein